MSHADVTGTHGTAAAAPSARPASPVSRREVLRSGGLLVGGVGAAALLAGCGPAVAPSWSFGPAPSPAATGPSPAASGSPAPGSPSPSSSAAAPASSAATASATPLPSGAAAAREPSPPDFAAPPPYRPAQSAPVAFNLTSYDGPGQSILIARSPDAVYGSMNFDGQVPAPTLRITEGDTVHFTLTNRGSMPHSIDFHAAQVAWSRVYQEVAPGATASFDWTAQYPGVFMYHCGAAPVLMHIADGMYGMAIVDPKGGRPTAHEYVIVQSEFYGAGGDYAKMLNAPPDFVVFNGQSLRHKTAPLAAKAGELVRLFILNAGPNSSSAFHVIGALFSHYEAEGYPPNAQGMHQTINVPPGDGALVELTFAEPGTYPFVTHKFSDASKGATGLFKVS